MTTIDGAELQRARWRRTLKELALDTTARDDFMLGGLTNRLANPTVRLLILPSDPDAVAIDIDDSLWAWLKNSEVFEASRRRIRLGTRQVPTAHAAALVESYGEREPWNSYVAVHRSGAIEYGLGDRGGWERDHDDARVRMFMLISIVARACAWFGFVSAVRERTVLPGPIQLTVALRNTQEALLGNVGEGWAEPMTMWNEIGGCQDKHLLWHFELDEWPDQEGRQDLAFEVGSRIEEAWGVSQRRYLAREGDLVGRLDTRRIQD